MSSKVKEVVKDFLGRKGQNYALLVNGDWGSGKTHFFKTLFENELKKFNLMYTSANGINSTSEIRDQILLLKIFGSKNIKAKRFIANKAGDLLNVFLKKKYSVETPSGNLEELNPFLSLNENDVLIIDDLERIGDKLSITKLFGYVSVNFLESTECKVIFISHEKEITNTNDKEYSRIKEKTIGHSIKYTLDVNSIFPSLIASEWIEIKSYLIKHQSFITKLIKEFQINNLRTILFFLSIIQKLYYNFPDSFEDSRFDESLISTILILCNEYKTGNFESFDDEDFPSYLDRKHPTFFSDAEIIAEFTIQKDYKDEQEKIEEEKTLKEKVRKLGNDFSQKYLTKYNNIYLPLKSVYLLIRNGYLNSELFNSELEDYIDSLDKSQSHHKLVDDLHSVLQMEQTELEVKWYEIIHHLRENRYGLIDILNVYRIYLQYSGIGVKFPHELEEVERFIKEAINNNKNSSNFPRPPHLDYLYTEFKNKYGNFEEIHSLANKKHLFHVSEINRVNTDGLIKKINQHRLEILSYEDFTLLIGSLTNNEDLAILFNLVLSKEKVAMKLLFQLSNKRRDFFQLVRNNTIAFENLKLLVNKETGFLEGTISYVNVVQLKEFIRKEFIKPLTISPTI